MTQLKATSLVSTDWIVDFIKKQQLKQNRVLECLSQSKLDGLTAGQFADLILGNDPFDGKTPVNLRTVRDILGNENVISTEVGEKQMIRYSKESLVRAARENKDKFIQNKWRLIYCSGLTMEGLGASMEAPQESGHYLINLRGWFTGESWQNQQIRLSGVDYERYIRAHPNILVEVFQIFKELDRTNELSYIRHWSDVIGNSADEYWVLDCTSSRSKEVQFYSEKKHRLPLSDCSRGPATAVYVCRKFDF